MTPTLLLLHYTGMASTELSLQRLCDPAAGVSCHYLVDEGGDVIQLVDEDRRAWHAGKSSWRGETDINSLSIGIEIQNIGHNGDYPPYAAPQMDGLIALCKEVIRRHDILPDAVLGHSDVAPGRKADPGEKFDWKRLHAEGIGHWVAAAEITAGPVLAEGDTGETVLALQKSLQLYGYGIDTTGIYDAQTKLVVLAFQRHFRPARIDGNADPSTILTLSRLISALGRAGIT